MFIPLTSFPNPLSLFKESQMDHVYMVSGCGDVSFDLLVKHREGDHEGVARLVGQKLLADETIASPNSVFGLNVFEFGDGPGVLESIHHTYWKLFLDPDAGEEWADSKHLKVEPEDE